MNNLTITERTRLIRNKNRGAHDRALLYSIIDAAYICHVGFINDNYPVVIPTACWRMDNYLYCHGAINSRLSHIAKTQQQVCVTITHVDGLVLARSAMHHSMNYRAAMIFAALTLVENTEAMPIWKKFINHIAPNRWQQVRVPNSKEIAATSLFRISLDEASTKVRTGPPEDLKSDLGRGVWAGEIPIKQVLQARVSDSKRIAGIAVPEVSIR